MLKKEEERQEVMDDEVKDRSSPHRDACYCLEVVQILVCVCEKKTRHRLSLGHCLRRVYVRSFTTKHQMCDLAMRRGGEEERRRGGDEERSDGCFGGRGCKSCLSE